MWQFAQAQVVVLDFEAPATSTTFQYFGSSLEATLTNVVANPNPTGANTSAKVLEFKKPSGAQVWAGAFSAPNPTTPVNVITNTKISIKVHMDHIGNLTLKLENSADGGSNWVQTKVNTVVNGWETLVFDVTVPSIEAPNAPASGHIYNTVTLFSDFGVSPAADVVSYIDDIKVEQVIVCNTALDFEAPTTNTTFQYFGSSLEAQLSNTINNPNPTGINTSAKVLEFKKPTGAQVWAGAFTAPNPTSQVSLLNDGQIKIKFHTDHPGNLTLKLEDSSNGGANWVQTVQNDVVNKWVELTFDPAIPSIEAPNLPATGKAYNRITLFADFGVAPTTDLVFYIDDIVVCSAGSAPKADVTFKVDMSKYTGAYTKVYVSGTFNNFSGDANQLTDANNDKIFEGTLSMPVGLYEYKFTLDNFTQQEIFDPTTTCTNTTIDGANVYVNRKLVLSGNSTVGPVCYNSCYGCGDGVKITFNLGMGTNTPATSGVYLAGGGDFGAPGGRFKMNDDNNDGVYSIQIERQRGYSTFYDFANGACPDYSCKENIAGQPCAIPTNYNDRFLNAVTQDTVVATCFASCATNTNCTIGTQNLTLDANWIKVQPSIATDQVQVLFSQAIEGSLYLRVFNANGREIYHARYPNTTELLQLETASWPKGMYTIFVQDNARVSNSRIIKM
jgi:hypothetical protein